MPTAQKKYLLWDFDGTLAWRPGGWSGAVLSVLRSSTTGISATPEQVRPFLQSGFPWHAPENPHPGLAANEWWDDLLPVFARAFKGLGVQGSEAMKLARKVRPVYLDPRSWKRYDDSLPALEALSAKGWKHILLTNHVPELPILLEQLGLASHFLHVYNSADTGYEKPNHKAYHMVMDAIQPCKETWVIGDDYHNDIVGARELGLPAILVRKPHPKVEIYCTTLKEIIEKL